MGKWPHAVLEDNDDYPKKLRDRRCAPRRRNIIGDSGKRPVRNVSAVVSKLYPLLLIIASLFVMSALGMVVVTVVAEVSQLVFTTNSQRMNR